MKHHSWLQTPLRFATLDSSLQYCIKCMNSYLCISDPSYPKSIFFSFPQILNFVQIVAKSLRNHLHLDILRSHRLEFRLSNSSTHTFLPIRFYISRLLPTLFLYYRCLYQYELYDIELLQSPYDLILLSISLYYMLNIINVGNVLIVVLFFFIL